jgi:radical SAM-linked protein
MAQRVPQGPQAAAAVLKVRVHYAKRGRLRFTSHRDFARAFERALRRADVPMAYSSGFNPHPKISYLGATPTGVASEAEYLEIGLVERVDLARLQSALDGALPDGLDVIELVEAAPGALADRMQASLWRLELPGIGVEQAELAVHALLAADQVLVTRLTKDGRREIDARAPIVSIEVSGGAAEPGDSRGANIGAYAILNMVVRQVAPAVRPDDVLAALGAVAGLALIVPPVAVRLAQGPLDGVGVIGDPLADDRVARESAL